MDIKQEHYSGKDVSARIDGGLQDSEMNGYLISLVRRQNKILKTINTIYEKAMTCDSINALGSACLDIIESITDSKASFIGKAGKDEMLDAIAIREPGGGLLESDSPENGSPFSHIDINSLYKEVVKSGKSLLINDPFLLPDNIGNTGNTPAIGSFLGVPLICDNRVAGLLAAANRSGGFREDDKEMLEAVAPTVFEVLSRKFTEETVRENAFLLRTIMDSSSDFLFIKDKDSRIVMVNQAYERVFGADTNDVNGKTDCGLDTDPLTAKSLIEDDQHVMQTGEPLIREVSAPTADGYRTFLMSKVPWHDSNGGILGILGIVHDITELKKTEAALQETVASLKRSKDYINILYETTGQVLSSPTPRKEITALCTKVMKFLDCHVFFNYLVEGDRPTLRLNSCGGVTDEQKQALDNLPLGSAVCGCAIRDGCRIVTEHIQTTPDPRTKFLKTIGIRAYACHPLMSDGKAIGGLAFGTRSRDEFDEEDLMLMKTVAESVAVAIRRKQNEETLLKQAEELIITDHNKNEFLSALSHELRNPMATIQAGLSLLDVAEDEEQQKRAKQIMRRQMEYLSRLVDDLLDITRINRNKIVLRKESFDLTNAISAVADDMKALFSGRGIKFLSNIGPEPIYIHADPVRVKQAIGNLLHNALKFSNDNGRVALSVLAKGDSVFITVEDTGIGIEPAFLSTIFEPFTQMDKSIDRRNGGLGLGLSIVKGIAELHGGSVSAYSAGPGKGSAFTICLPL
jgi:PAS domain S-box-containing protein